MEQLNQWPYGLGLDRMGIGLVPIPEAARPYCFKGWRVELMLPDGKTMKGTVQYFNRISWIARVKVYEEDGHG